jgi:hypothetical protein
MTICRTCRRDTEHCEENVCQGCHNSCYNPIVCSYAAYQAAGGPAPSTVTHPPHYGGEADPFEAIKVIEAWGLGFALGNALKYIRRADAKGTRVDNLEKARWYLDREIQRYKKGKPV